MFMKFVPFLFQREREKGGKKGGRQEKVVRNSPLISFMGLIIFNMPPLLVLAPSSKASLVGCCHEKCWVSAKVTELSFFQLPWTQKLRESLVLLGFY